jgi:hypothetical protein
VPKEKSLGEVNMAAEQKPYSPWRQSTRLTITLVLMNSFFILFGQRRVALGLDVFIFALAIIAITATRIWPDKIWFRRPGEPRYSETPHPKPEWGSNRQDNSK